MLASQNGSKTPKITVRFFIFISNNLYLYSIKYFISMSRTIWMRWKLVERV